jgi:hypothetical protein
MGLRNFMKERRQRKARRRRRRETRKREGYEGLIDKAKRTPFGGSG